MEEFGINLHVDELVSIQFQHWVAPPLFEDTFPFLETLQNAGLKIAIVSNIDRADIEAALISTGIKCDAVLTSEDVRAYKPHPDLFSTALDMMQIDRDEVLLVGDSRTSDVAGAIRAGIPVAWINRTGKTTDGDLVPNYEVSSLSELSGIVADLSA